MSRVGIALLAAAAGWTAGLASGGCSESAWAPAPESHSCGTAARPCELRGCEMPCAARAVDLAEGCVQPLQGRLEETRRRCVFDDGSRAHFVEPLASTQPAVDHQSIELELTRGGERCLLVRSVLAGDSSRLFEIEIGDLSYRQEVWLERAGGDGGVDAGSIDAGSTDGAAIDGPPPAIDSGPIDGGPADAAAPADALGDSGDGAGSPLPARVAVVCNGRHYLRQGDLCRECGGDGGSGSDGCEGLGLLRLRVLMEQPPSTGLEVRLEASGRTTPLFTCR